MLALYPKTKKKTKKALNSGNASDEKNPHSGGRKNFFLINLIEFLK